jgi:single-stranded DNA-specific DHH superfamily exonuclease
MIAPRLNAGGRMTTPYDSLNTLIFSQEKQLEAIKKLEKLNTSRRNVQEKVFKEVTKNLDLDKNILISK